MIRTLTTATLALAALVGTAAAADLPSRKAPVAYAPAALAYSWTGFYVGGQLGYGWVDDRTSEFVTATGAYNNFTKVMKLDGVFGGLHAGYNMQSGALVYGLEADAEVSGIKGGFVLPNGEGGSSKHKWQGSLRGRVGVAFDRTLFYVTGGAALVELEHTAFSRRARETYSNTRLGWTLGAGVEYALSDKWSVRGEYRYTDYGTFRNDSQVAFRGFSQQQEPREHAVRLGVSYHFGGPSAVVAKY